MDILRVAPSAITNWSYNKNRVEFVIEAELPSAESDDSYTYTYTLALERVGAGLLPQNPVLEVDREELVVDGPGFPETTLLKNERDGVKLLHEDKYKSGEHDLYVATTSPRGQTMLSRLYDLKSNALANGFKRYMNNWSYFSFERQALEDPSYTPNQVVLGPQGQGLSSALYQVKQSDEMTYRSIIECLQAIEPSVEVINFFGAGNEKQVFMVFEDRARNRLPAYMLSDGTIRFLAIVYVLLVAPRLSHPYKPFVILEEPENGIYAGILRRILDLLKDSPNPPQTLFTTHAPYLIDLFDDSLDWVFVTNKDEYRSTIKPVDRAAAEKRLKTMPLGEQHYQGLLK